ncbi:hypothetical protein [Paraburkholderia sp. SIMBA_054]|uniref:hypothetical protein n=1 Tax=Paraburkholderia sp. SIMBA_054 TaxID=3085795 RepID=UPI003978FD4E
MLVNLQYRGEIYMSDSLTAVGCRPAGLSPCATRYNMAERRAGCCDMRLIQLSPQVALVSNAIRRAQQRGAKLIVLGSRKSENAEVAASGLSLKPGPDEAMCCGRLKALSSRGHIWPRNQMTMGKKGSPTNCFKKAEFGHLRPFAIVCEWQISSVLLTLAARKLGIEFGQCGNLIRRPDDALHCSHEPRPTDRRRASRRSVCWSRMSPQKRLWRLCDLVDR